MQQDHDYEFRIFVLQGYHPDIGQEALVKLGVEVDKDIKSTSPKFKVELEGVNRFKSPFIEEYVSEIKLLIPGILYDEFNFLFKYPCENLDFARELEKKFNTWKIETNQKLAKAFNTAITEENKQALLAQGKFLTMLAYSITEHDRAFLGPHQELKNY